MPERMIDVNGVSLWLAETGSGRPLLLLLGGVGIGDYLGSFTDQIDSMATVYRLEAAGVRVMMASTIWRQRSMIWQRSKRNLAMNAGSSLVTRTARFTHLLTR